MYKPLWVATAPYSAVAHTDRRHGLPVPCLFSRTVHLPVHQACSPASATCGFLTGSMTQVLPPPPLPLIPQGPGWHLALLIHSPGLALVLSSVTFTCVFAWLICGWLNL